MFSPHHSFISLKSPGKLGICSLCCHLSTERKTFAPHYVDIQSAVMANVIN